jgi:LIM domain
MISLRAVQPQVQQYQPQQPPPQQPRGALAKPPGGRVLDGPDLDLMLADISRTSTRDLDRGGPSSRGDCAHCQKPILGEVIQALNRTYHPEHFMCGNCQSPLGTSNFYEQDGVPNCEKCYQELFCSRCAHCDEPITGRCITALNRKWHLEHFVCGQCLGPFPGGTFFEKEGRPYCDNCFHNAFSSRCAGCNQSIKGECINALGQQWHPEHFVCHYCQKSFGNGSFYEYSGKPYCETHYHQQTGSLCAGCGKAVTGRMVNALDKKWHPEHFVCSFCMQPLAGGAFTENAGKAYCKECHGKLFG